MANVEGTAVHRSAESSLRIVKLLSDIISVCHGLVSEIKIDGIEIKFTPPQFDAKKLVEQLSSEDMPKTEEEWMFASVEQPQQPTILTDFAPRV